MTTEEQTNILGEPSSTSWVLTALFWAYVGIPLIWGVYEAIKGTAALFTG